MAKRGPKKSIHCKRGHERSPENVYKNGSCRLCQIARHGTGLGKGSFHRLKTHCKNGHEFNEKNTKFYVGPGRGIERRCLICAYACNKRHSKKSNSTRVDVVAEILKDNPVPKKPPVNERVEFGVERMLRLAGMRYRKPVYTL